MKKLDGMATATNKLGAAVTSLAIALLVSACGEQQADTAPDPIRPAILVEIGSMENVRSIDLPAVIEAAETADITFQVAGTLEELPIKAGDEVAKGDVIGRLNQREFINSVDRARAEFTVAEAQFGRAEQLIGDSLISQADYEQLETQLSVARAALDSAEKALEDTVLRSPFTGVVATVAVDQFQNVSPSTPIVTIQTTGVAKAVVQVPAKMVANSGRLLPRELLVVLDAAPDQPLTAELYETNTQAEASTQTFEASFRFTPPEELLILPGMTGTLRASFLIPDADGQAAQINVPLGAILTEAGQQFVWRVDTSTMTVSKQPVVLEPGIGESLIVREGLSVGDTIVGAGASYLFEGMTIRRYEG